MKKILGLDLGTNSIGWALINLDFENKKGNIEGMGSRIIPLSQDIIGDFNKGNSISQTAERTRYRSIRRLRECYLLRRERLHRVLNILDYLPEHYAKQIDFKYRLGKFLDETVPKLAYKDREFIFKKSFDEMLEDFITNQPELLNRKNRRGEKVKIPYDWTIYYLRKKALTQKIEKEELAWILLNFNQKRGYYQLRGEIEEKKPNKLVEYHSLKIVEVEVDKETNKKGENWYSLHLENGWVYRRSSKSDLSNWKDKVRDFIVTTDLKDDGSIKTDNEGNERRSFRAPGEDDWTLIKKKTEQEILDSEKTVGTYIYDTLLKKPDQKIKGKLVRTIDRAIYKDELKAILNTQKKFHSELQNENIYNDCIRELYRNNQGHQIFLNTRDIVHLFVEDIIFYQRPLRSQKSSIGNCSLEFRKYKLNGEEKTEYLKAIPKSHPLYQEFRLWQWLYNLKIYEKENNTNVTLQFISNIKDFESLFEFLNDRREIDQKSLLKYFNIRDKKYRWNYIEDKRYPCNETGIQIKTRMAKVENVFSGFLTPEIEQKLWHIIYSVTDKIEFEKALKTFANKQGLEVSSFVENFKKFPPFKSEFSAYSEKAIKKLLPLMRLGKFWRWETIDQNTRNRIDKIITGEYDKEIINRVREKAIHLTKEFDFQGLQLWLAQYIVYGRHSESNFSGKWNSVEDLEKYLVEFKQHSLRNPIVEQVITETLRVVKDIWIEYGNGTKDFFTEIHVELGREMKNTAEDRGKITNKVAENENTNLRIKAFLAELLADNNVENVRTYSPMQHEILKIYEDGALNSPDELPDDILKISKTANPSRSQLQRYKLWLEQRYRSPYTGEVIPLNKLFTSAYEIEHVIPQSHYFDDSFNNKVICEATVNKLKDRQLGLEFIKKHHGEKVETGFGNSVEIFSEESYKNFINEHYAKNRSKRNKLFLEEIPEKMIERQINDTRYISKFISNLLSSIVRAESNDDGFNSKNVLPGNGKITYSLKKDWGMDAVWNELILPRFERLNDLTKTQDFTAWNEKHQKYLPTVPFELSKGFKKKRIDHRHHAMDALIIACATRDHINLLNNKHANTDKVRYDLQRKLRKFERKKFQDKKTGEFIEKEVPKEFIKPWNNFTVDARDKLEKIVVSFKQNLRVINKTTNRYQKYVEKNGKKVKLYVPQEKGDSWAIRKPMHKETVSGQVKIDRIKIPKGKNLTATRKSIDPTFDLKTIESITDSGIQKILKNYLSSKDNNPELAFSPEGLEEMNKNIENYNGGKRHQPIYKARIFEVGNKFPLGQTGNKDKKYVEAAKGTNLFFVIYEKIDGSDRLITKYSTIPLKDVIDSFKEGLPIAERKEGYHWFSLSPNDLVFVPNEEEKQYISSINWEDLSKDQINRIYKVVSCTNNQLFFVPASVSSSIKDKFEFSPLNKMEKTIDGNYMIKKVCLKLSVNRLGKVSQAHFDSDILDKIK